MERGTKNELELTKKMYATVCGGADRALTLLETGNVWDAKRTLQKALRDAEELYLACPPEGKVLDTPGESC